MATTHPLATAGFRPAALWESLKQLPDRKWFPVVLNMAAVLLLAYSMAQWTWRIFTPPKTPVVADASALAQTKTATLGIQDLLAGHLFGKTASKVAPTAAPIEDIPESSLNMILTGVVAAGDDSLALIKVNDEPETPFAIGEELTRGVTLQAVYPDRAIIERRGVTEALLLEDAAASLLKTPVAERPASPTRGGIQAQGNNTFTIDRATLNEELNNQDLFRQALIVPNAGGGFLVRQIQPGSLYEKLGLKVGDVIRGVNGRSVNTIDQVLQVYQQLGGVDQLTGVQLEVMRAGQIQQLQYTIQ
ncbi:MAG: type II secretion system protein N [Acidiferrobacterales bacterium]